MSQSVAGYLNARQRIAPAKALVPRVTIKLNKCIAVSVNKPWLMAGDGLAEQSAGGGEKAQNGGHKPFI